MKKRISAIIAAAVMTLVPVVGVYAADLAISPDITVKPAETSAQQKNWQADNITYASPAVSPNITVKPADTGTRNEGVTCIACFNPVISPRL